MSARCNWAQSMHSADGSICTSMVISISQGANAHGGNCLMFCAVAVCVKCEASLAAFDTVEEQVSVKMERCMQTQLQPHQMIYYEYFSIHCLRISHGLQSHSRFQQQMWQRWLTKLLRTKSALTIDDKPGSVALRCACTVDKIPIHICQSYLNGHSSSHQRVSWC